MKINLLFLLFLTLVARAQEAELWITKSDQSILFQKQFNKSVFGPITNTLPSIYVDDTKRFQTMDGFGYTLTGGSAQLLARMNNADRAQLLQELFATDQNNIGVSYLRISIGASDLSDHVFTYNDMPAGKTDPTLSQFTLAEEKKELIPVLKQILKINPQIKILGSPWTPPTWMKTNGASKGGSLKPEFYDVYARYLVKYIQEMQKEGIRIDAITVQNEPLHPGNNPSLLMPQDEQTAFIKKSLGPAFTAAKVATKIIVYDHNADRPDYPISILNDPEARKYVDGSAFHLYGGNVEALQDVHEAHPDKNVYFTEQWIGAPANFGGDLLWHVKNLIIGASKNWAKTVLEWNLAADPDQKPFTDGGCTACLGAVTIGEKVSRNPAYYIIAHASKFVRPGSVRIASNVTMSLSNVAFKTPTGQTVLIVMNESDKPVEFNIRYKGKQNMSALSAKTVATFIW
ncbi:glycoside hydrolase family 30 beta sandwich domain-containing protein [Runella sp.]|uniref:glycoside hydrolase family 30 protein n=2 Tax=Runella sp. TaxID=1960881 RepID=UPI003015E6E1